MNGAELFVACLQNQGVEWIASLLGPIDFPEVARGLGALGARVETPDELQHTLRQALAERTPTLIHAPICGGMPAVE